MNGKKSYFFKHTFCKLYWYIFRNNGILLIKIEVCQMQKQTSELFLWRSVLKKCSKFTGEQACQSVISIKLLCNFIEIALWHWCSTALLHVFRTLFNKNTSGGLLSLFTVFSWFSYYSDYKIIAVRVLNGVWLTFYIYKIKVCGLFRKKFRDAGKYKPILNCW